MAPDEKQAQFRLDRRREERRQRPIPPEWDWLSFDLNTPVVVLDEIAHMGRDHFVLFTDEQRRAVSDIASLTDEQLMQLQTAIKEVASIVAVRRDTGLWEASPRERQALMGMVRWWVANQTHAEGLVGWWQEQTWQQREDIARRKAVARNVALISSVTIILNSVFALLYFIILHAAIK